MLQQSNDDPYETAHLVARLAGEEGPEHPRQKIARWLKGGGRGDDIARFNQLYAESCARHAHDRRHAKGGFASYEVFGHLLGQSGDPGIDSQWVDILHTA